MSLAGRLWVQCPSSLDAWAPRHSPHGGTLGRWISTSRSASERGLGEHRSQAAFPGFHDAQTGCMSLKWITKWEDVSALSLWAALYSIGFRKGIGDPTFCPPAAFTQHLNFSSSPTASDRPVPHQCMPVLPAMGTDTLLSLFLCLPGPPGPLLPFHSPSCFHHQLIWNPPSPLDRVSNFLLFCV